MAKSEGQTLSELRGMPEAELRQQAGQRRAELAVLRIKARQGALEQPHQVRRLRREIARLLTIAHEAGRVKR